VKAAALAPLCLIFSPALLRAHQLRIDYRPLPEGGIRLEVYYSDGKPASGAEVVARGPDGAEVARGAADLQGVFEFRAPPGLSLEVEARHQGGHRATLAFVAGAPGTESPARGAIPYWGLITGLVAIAALALLVRWGFRRRRAS